MLATALLAAATPHAACAQASSPRVVVGRGGWLFFAFDDPKAFEPARQQRICGIINDAIRTLRSSGIEVAIALTPAKSRVYRDLLPAEFSFTPESEPRYAAALALFRQSGALAPDLHAPLAAMRRATPDELVFFKGDTHWTAAAAECAAAEMARQIRSSSPLPQSRRRGTVLGEPVSMAHSGADLVQLLPLQERSSYGPETYRVRAPKMTASTVALADDDADVAVVGNSYMQARYNFAAMLSNQLDRPVSLLWKMHHHSPYRTLLDYLGSEMFRKARPKLLVWNLHEVDTQITANNRSAWLQNAMEPQAFLTELRRAVGA